jgi:SAM-dependent methyltransferase
MTIPFYRAYEDRYRGARELIKQRLRAYQPFLAPMVPRDVPAAALDLGCGRGEWLELLGELGFQARGVDLDEGMLEACRERGLEATLGDALAALRACPDASLALVSAFHLVEHIPFDAVSELIAQSLRALRPGGLLIMETPNSENLVVGASTFYSDPSHLRPLPPTLLSFATEHAGFARQHVLRLQEATELHGTGPVSLFDVLGGVSPDYSVVAQKAAPASQWAPFDPAFAASYGIDLHTLAQRYDEARQAEQWRNVNELGFFEQRATAELNLLSSAFAQLSESVRDGAAVTDAVARQLQSALENANERALARSAELEALSAAVAQHHAEADAAMERIQAIEAIQAEQVQNIKEQAEYIKVQAQEITARNGDLANIQARLDEALANSRARLDERLASSQAELDARLAAEHSGNEQHLQVVLRATDELITRLSLAEAESRLMERRVVDLLSSSSWRVTGPLRLIGGQAARFKAIVRRRHPEQSDMPPIESPVAAHLRGALRKAVRVTLRHTGLKPAALRILQHFPRLHSGIYRTMYQNGDVRHLDPAGPRPAGEQGIGDLSPRALRLYGKLKRIQADTEAH